MAKKHRSFRWITTADFDADAFFLDEGDWFIFVYMKNAALNWSEVALKGIEAKFDRGQIRLIAGALKTKEKSEPLPTKIPTMMKEKITKIPEFVNCYESGLKFRLETQNVLNPGLFLDQELNRQRLGELIEVKSGGKQLMGSCKLLNLFSFTGAFSVVANCLGVETISIDVSSRYLEWEKRNQGLNAPEKKQAWANLYPAIKLLKSDARDFIRRAATKPDKYTFIIIDPPTFSRADGEPFKVQEHLHVLVSEAIKCLDTKQAAMLVSSNDSTWPAEEFYKTFEGIAKIRGMKAERGKLPDEYSKISPPYPLKSIWLLRG